MSNVQYIIDELATGWAIGFVLACVLLTIVGNIVAII